MKAVEISITMLAVITQGKLMKFIWVYRLSV